MAIDPPSAVRRRFAHDGDDATILEALLDRDALAEFDAIAPLVDGALGFLLGVIAQARRIPHDVGQHHARLHHIGGKAVHFQVTAIAHDQPLVGIEQAQSLNHVADGDVELTVFGMQLLGNAQQLQFAPLHVSDVGSDRYDAAVGGAFFIR